MLLDLDMPNMGGEETNALLCERHPSVLVIVITGHHDPVREQRLLLSGVLQVLHKPVMPNLLLTAIHDALREHDDDEQFTDKITANVDLRAIRKPTNKPE